MGASEMASILDYDLVRRGICTATTMPQELGLAAGPNCMIDWCNAHPQELDDPLASHLFTKHGAFLVPLYP